MKEKCQFCNHTLSNKSNLIFHQKNNKKCLDIQISKCVEIKSNLKECEYCNKKFNKNAIKKHFLVCNLKKEKDYESKILELEKQVNELKKDKDFEIENNKPLILNNVTIISREDGFINATQLCQAGNKKFNDYKRTNQTQEYLQALSSNTGIPVMNLISSNIGGNHSGTWVHRKVAIHLAQWISPDFSVKVSNWIDELMLTGKVILGNEKSNHGLENIYKDKINSLNKELELKNNQLKVYDINIFNSEIDYCPIEFYCKDIVYFLKFDIPEEFKNNYISKYPNIINSDYKCVEFGVSSDIEKRMKSHKRDKYKNNIVFIYALEITNRYTASKIEFYTKTIVKQLNVFLDYAKKKECCLVNEEEFNILINKVKLGIENIKDINIDENDEYYNIQQEIEDGEIEDENKDKRYTEQTYIELHKINKNTEIEIKKIESETEIRKIESETEIRKIELEIKKIETEMKNIENDRQLKKTSL